MGLRKYVARRVIYTITLLFLIVLFNYFLFQVLPFLVNCGGQTYQECAVNRYLPETPPPGAANYNITKIIQKQISLDFGFNLPPLERIALYVRNMFTGNFGYHVGSYGSGPVWDTIAIAAPYTILLLGLSTIATFVIGIGLGVIAGAKRGKFMDVSSLATLLFLNSLPVFFVGSLLQLMQIFAGGGSYLSLTIQTQDKVGWLFYEGVLKALFLPFITLTVAGVGGVFLTQRAVLIDALAEDYILMARAKGVPERTVLYKHGLRNAILPIVTAFALSVGFILAGAVITETVFSYPGLGLNLFEGVILSDFPLEQALFFIISIMVVISVFIADILHGFLDPRVVTA